MAKMPSPEFTIHLPPGGHHRDVIVDHALHDLMRRDGFGQRGKPAQIGHQHTRDTALFDRAECVRCNRNSMRHVRAEKPSELFFRQHSALTFNIRRTGYTDAQDNGHHQEGQHFVNFRANENFHPANIFRIVPGDYAIVPNRQQDQEAPSYNGSNAGREKVARFVA